MKLASADRPYDVESDAFLRIVVTSFERDLFSIDLAQVPARTERFCRDLDRYVKALERSKGGGQETAKGRA